MRYTGDRITGRLLGVQLFGHKNAEIAKRIDIAATAIFHGIDCRWHERTGPLLHPAARQPLGRRADGCPSVGPGVMGVRAAGFTSAQAMNTRPGK
jgi:hypothetical protein